jgi:ankyrin repeat protein
MAELLIQKSADVNAKDQRGRTPLWFAMGEKDLVMTKLLISKGTDLNIKDKAGYTPLFWAAFTSSKDVLDLILSKGDYPDTIHLAACKADLSRVKTLIEQGTNIDIKDEFGCTPLHWAVAANSQEVTDYLLDKGADPNIRDGRGLTPVMTASDVSMLKRLIPKGADIQSNDRSGQTKLHMVCASGNKDAAELLIRNGAEINARANDGATPLFYAAISGHVDIVKLLISKAADINIPTQTGKTPIAMAKVRGHTEVVNILRQHGARETLHGSAASANALLCKGPTLMPRIRMARLLFTFLS